MPSKNSPAHGSVRVRISHRGRLVSGVAYGLVSVFKFSL